MPTAVPYNSEARRRVEGVVPVRDGHRATKYFKVSTSINGDWEGADGLPQRGDEYVDEKGVARGCYAATIEKIDEGGSAGPAQPGYDPDNNGFAIVRVQYLPIRGGNGNIGLNLSYTQFSAGVSAQRIFYPRDADGLPDATATRQLAGGQGAVVQNGEITATLYRYFPGGVPGAFTAQMINLCTPCHVNDTGVSFPRVGGQSSTQTQVLGPGQALFRGFGEARLVNTNVYQVPLYFGLAVDWLYRDAEEADDGAVSALLAETVYPSGNMNILIA